MHAAHYSVTLNVAQALREFTVLASRYPIDGMKAVDEIRRENIALLAEEAGSLRSLAEEVEVSESQMSQWANGSLDSKTGKRRGMRPESCRRIELARGKPEGWLDREHPKDAAPEPSVDADEMPDLRNTLRAPRAVPVVGRCQGGFPARVWGDDDQPVGVTDEYAMVATIDDNAFVCHVVGTSMVSRYMPGEYALIEPNTAPEIEDDVLVRLHTGETMLKRLLSRRGGVRLGSYADPEVFSYREDEITWMYYVAHPIPARRIKHRMESDEYRGEDRRHVDRPQRAHTYAELVGGISQLGGLDEDEQQTPPRRQEGQS